MEKEFRMRWMAILALTLGLQACGGSGGGAVPTLGSEGGTTSSPGNEAIVVVPPGALETPTTIRVAKDSSGAPPLPEALPRAGDIYVVTPHGGSFQEDVEVSLPLPVVELLPTQELKLAKTNADGEWEVLGETVIEGGRLKAKVRSFSWFTTTVVTYLAPLSSAEPLQITSTLDCGGQICAQALGTVNATLTVTTNNGQLPAGCQIGGLRLDTNHTDRWSAFELLRADEPVLRVVQPSEISLNYYFNISLFCGSHTQRKGQRVIYWRNPRASFPSLAVERMASQLDIVEGLPARIEAFLSGGAVRFDHEGQDGFMAPTATDHAIVDWQRSDDEGSSWRVIARSHQHEATPLYSANKFDWMMWSVHHGFVAQASDHGALIRVRACYTPPAGTEPPPCAFGPAARLNLLQQSALPAIAQAPRSVLVTTGQTASFSATASGLPTPELQWQTRAANADGDWSDIAGATGAQYTTPVLTLADNGRQYRVVASNALGSVESVGVTASVSAEDVAPAITTQPADLAVVAGGDAVFAIAASGTEALSYQWRRNGSAIAGANSPILRLTAVGEAQAGRYSVQVSNAAGSVTSDEAELTVRPGSPAVVAPSVVTQPVAVRVNVGNTATFAVGVAGSGPFNYQWRRNGSPIASATDAYYSIAAAAEGDAANYSVRVSNSVGEAVSAAAALTVDSTPQAAPVTIDVHPAPQVQSPDGSATFAVAASGSGPLRYQWLRNGEPIGDANGPVLILSRIGSDQVGEYRVVVSNSLGSVTSNGAELLLIGAPTIVAQPAAVTVGAGASATFTVAATGDPLSYQWLRNGEPIAGAVAEKYILVAAQAADSGAAFSVLVYNGAGSVFSDGAVLTVSGTAPDARVISLRPDGGDLDHHSYFPSVSSDGARVGFRSLANNLVPETTGSLTHGYVRDLISNATELVDVTPSGTPSGSGVLSLKLAAGGRHAVFTSVSNDLVSGDSNSAEDVFVRDLERGVTERVNLMPDGSQDPSGGGVSGFADISADGRMVLMRSGSALDGETALGSGLFLLDRETRILRRIGGEVQQTSARVSDDGSTVVFHTTLRRDQTVALFAYDVASGGSALLLEGHVDTTGGISRLSVSADGQRIAFASSSAAPFGSANSRQQQVWLLDRGSGATTLLSTSPAGIGERLSTDPAISADGRCVLFQSEARNVTGFNDSRAYLMLREIDSGALLLASRREDGTRVPVESFGSVLAGDCSALYFTQLQHEWKGVAFDGSNGVRLVVRTPRP